MRGRKLGDIQQQIVHLAPNVYPIKPNKRYNVLSFEKLKKDAEIYYGVNEAQIMDEYGNIIESIEEIAELCKRPKQTVLIVANKGAELAKKPVIKKKIQVQEVQRSDIKEMIAEAVSTPTPQYVETTETIEDRANFYVALSKLPILQAQELARFAAFANLSDEDQQKIPEAQEIIKSINNNRQSMFYRQLVEQRICSLNSVSPVNKALTEWSTEILKRIKLDNINIVLSGSRYSGKTMTLNNLSTIFYRKLSMCNLTSQYLMMPLNFANYLYEQENEIVFYHLFVNIIIDSLIYCCPQIFPISEDVRKLLLALPDQLTVRKLLPYANKIKNFDLEGFERLCKDIIAAFQFNEKNAARNTSRQSVIYNQILNLPSVFAKIFGLTGVVFIIDHLDFCRQDIAQQFTAVLDSSSYIVSMQNAEVFRSNFPLKTAILLETDRMLENVDERFITIQNPNFDFTQRMCVGCPGALSVFIRTCDAIERLKPLKSPRMFKLAVDKSRETELNGLVLTLALVLQAIDEKNVPLDIIDEISESTTMKVTVNGGNKETVKPAPQPKPKASPSKKPENIPSFDVSSKNKLAQDLLNEELSDSDEENEPIKPVSTPKQHEIKQQIEEEETEEEDEKPLPKNQNSSDIDDEPPKISPKKPMFSDDEEEIKPSPKKSSQKPAFSDEDDEPPKPSPKKPMFSDDEEEIKSPPKKSPKKPMFSDEDDEPPRKSPKKQVLSDEEEEIKSSLKKSPKKPMFSDEDDEPPRKLPKKPMFSDDEEEEIKSSPKKSPKKPMFSDDEDDIPPKPKKMAFSDEDEEEIKPSPKKSQKKPMFSDEDEEEIRKPKKKMMFSDEDSDEEVVQKPRKGKQKPPPPQDDSDEDDDDLSSPPPPAKKPSPVKKPTPKKSPYFSSDDDINKQLDDDVDDDDEFDDDD